jgi:predicted amidohydrolase
MAQILVEGGQPEANLDRAVGRVQEAAAQGCRLVVLPECMDLGWTDPSARTLAQPIPGPYSDRLARAARGEDIFVAGLVERSGERLFNAGVLIDPSGKILLVHRKINELDLAHDLYSIGDRLGMAQTPLGTLAVNICADNFIGVSNVGRLTCGPWKGRKVIGCSLAVGPGGTILAEGPYGDDAEALVIVEIDPRPPIAKGTLVAEALRGRGYHGA